MATIQDALESGPYYCYILRYPDRADLWFEPGKPFYVGKGRGNRIEQWHALRENRRGKRAINKEVCRLIDAVVWFDTDIIWDGMDEDSAFEWEKALIRFWGRRDIGTGILLNCTDGGRENNGYSESYIEDHRQRSKAAWQDPVQAHKMREGTIRAKRMTALERKQRDEARKLQKAATAEQRHLETLQRRSAKEVSRKTPWLPGLAAYHQSYARNSEINRRLYFHKTRGWMLRTPSGDVPVESRQHGLMLLATLEPS